MATNFVAKFANMADIILFCTLAFQNGLQYHNFDFKTLNGDDFSTFF